MICVSKEEEVEMEEKMIVRIEKCLDKMIHKNVKVYQNGFIMNQFLIENMVFKIRNDILNLKDETKDIYLVINLNQVYQVEISEKKLILYIDNDTNIEISL